MSTHGQVQQIRSRGQDLATTEHWLIDRWLIEASLELWEQLLELLDFWAELAIELVTPDSREVIATRLKEGVRKVITGRIGSSGLAGAGTLVDLNESLFLGDHEFAVFFPLAFKEIEVTHEGLKESGEVLFVVAQRTNQQE
ncbi:unannotated protein [freshwater metagenome]|uniref:Unannotated protein n=1 Tax=freshwater metagenome TaxID=449393 RepID=A0A6J7RSA4_9ZZZZ